MFQSNGEFDEIGDVCSNSMQLGPKILQVSAVMKGSFLTRQIDISFSFKKLPLIYASE